MGLERIERWLPQIYLAVALAVTATLCLVTAPFFAPDEPNQSCRAIALSHGGLIAEMGPVEAGARIDAGAFRAMDEMSDIRMRWEKERGTKNVHDRPWGPVTDAEQRGLAGMRWARKTVFVPFSNTAAYPPMLYLPAMAGWRAAESLNLTIFWSLRLVRLLCALTAVGLGWWALRMCPALDRRSAGWMLLPFLLLPSTLFLNASCSQDAALLGVAALIAATLSRVLAAGREFTGGELAAMAAMLAMCGAARPPNAAIALVLFLPGVETAGRGWRRWIGPATAFAAVVAVCGAWRYAVRDVGFEWSDEAEPELQAAFLRAHPLASAWAMVHGTVAEVRDFAQRGVYVVGWNDLLPHHGAAAVLVVCLAAMLLFGPRVVIRTGRGWAVLSLAVALPLLGISLAEYVIWTPPGFGTVYGIQPRYWLPMMPLATMLAMGRLRIGGEQLRAWGLLAAATGLAALACTLPWFAAHAFYREGLARVLELNLR